MTMRGYKDLGRSFKSLLYTIAGLFAIAAVIIAYLWATAATSTGVSPTTAITLVEGVNTGILGPGQQRWFRFAADEEGRAIQVPQSFTLIFTPDDGNRIREISMELFEGAEARRFNLGNDEDLKNFGAGMVVSRDSNPITGERLWSGWLIGSDTYYIQVKNRSTETIDYWLFTDDVDNVLLGEPEPPPAAVVAELGSAPTNPAQLASGTTRGTLNPHSTYWYAFKYEDFATNARTQLRDFTMFFTPDDGNRRHHVNFEIFPLQEFHKWQRGEAEELTNLGAGGLVSRDQDPNTGERVWRGSVVNGDTYLMAIENGSEVEIDYWVLEGDIYTPQLGPVPTPTLPPVFVAGTAPTTALALQLGVNTGSVEPGEEVWYSFRLTDFDREQFEEMALTMVTTPDDGNRIRHMVFEVFTEAGVQQWSPGDNSRIDNVGAGGVVFRDDNPFTGERVWKGWVVDNDLYFVQIRNGADVKMDYWLFTGDVYRPELGPPSQPTAQATVTPNPRSQAAQPLQVGVNPGRLNPQEERWYRFSRADAAEQSEAVETGFSLVVTAEDSRQVDGVQFELLTGGTANRVVAEGSTELTSLGSSQAISRDDDPNTGELLWEGPISAETPHYLRVRNETRKPLEYQIFPEEIVNANLD